MDAEVKITLLKCLSSLSKAVGALSNLYYEHEELNDQVDISQIAPMSLDDWEIAIDSTIYDIDVLIEEKKAKFIGVHYNVDGKIWLEKVEAADIDDALAQMKRNDTGVVVLTEQDFNKIKATEILKDGLTPIN